MSLFPRFLTFLAGLLLLAKPAAATLVRTDGPAQIANPSGLLVGADATDGDPATNRHLVQLRINTTLRAQGAGNNFGSFRVRFALTNAAGTPVLLEDGNGGTATIVTTDSQSVNLFESGASEVLRFAWDAVPAAPLDLSQRYRVQAEIQRNVLGVWTQQSVRQSSLITLQELVATVSPDPLWNVVGRMNTPSLVQPVIFKNADGSGGFVVNADLALFRYDDYTEAAPPAAEVPVTVTLSMHDETTDTDVPLVNPSLSQTVSLPGFLQNEEERDPATASMPVTLAAQPVDWTQFNAAHTYSLKLTARYTESDNTETVLTPAPVAAAPPQRLLALSGVIRFGGIIDGRFTAIAGDPRASFTETGDGSIIIAAGNGQVGDSVRRFGDGLTPLSVVLFNNGDLACLGGSLAFNTTATDLHTIAGVRLVRGPGTLDNTGLKFAQLGVFLPGGMGFSTTASGRRLRGTHTWTNVPCDDDMLPYGAASLTFSAGDYAVPSLHVVQEGQPVRLETTQVEWIIAEGRFVLDSAGSAHYVRRPEDLSLQASTGTAWATNDGYYRSASGHQGAEVASDGQGCGRLTAQLNLSAGDFRAHHPWQAQISWVGNGTVQINSGRVIPAGSSLTQSVVGDFQYEAGCSRDGNCAQVQTVSVPALPLADWAFTPDGGLRATVQFAADESVRWGKNGATTYTHRTAGFATARFHMTGTAFRPLEMSGNSWDLGQEAAILHLTGYSAPGDEMRIERPGVLPAEPSRQGLADYAGLNFRATEMAVRTASSRLAGGDVPDYPLHPAAKYYVRFGGVSGRHQAAAATPGVPSVSTVRMFGFDCQLDGLKLGYLDSDNVFSLTGGSIHVPGPSNFDQTFAELRFDCSGRPRDAALADEDLNDMVHWSSRFRPLTFRFQPAILTSGCPSFEDGVLALGAAVLAPSLTSSPLHAELGFKPDGTLTTKADGPRYEGTSSELMLPPQLKLNGGLGPEYTLTPHGKAYFSRATAVSPAAEGWINLYGGLDVPFFQDVKVHLHATNSANASGSIYVMGGWPASDAGVNQHGWNIGGKTPFNDALFDANQTGYAGPSRDDYRSPKNNLPLYRPRAEQDWLEVVKLGYALKWETATRRFTTLRDEETNLVVIKAQHRLLSLTSSTAEITFGVKVEGFPALNVSKLLTDQINGGLNGLLSSLAAQGLNAAGLNEAVQGFDRLLAAQIGDLMNAPLDETLDALDFNFEPEAWLTNPSAGATAYADRIAGLAGPDGPLTAELQRRLNDVIAALTILEGFIPSGDPAQGLGRLAKAVLTNARTRGELAGPLVSNLGDAASGILGAVGSSGQAEKSVPAFEQIQASVAQLRARVTALRDTLASSSNPLRSELHRAISNKVPYEGRLASELGNYFVSIGNTEAAIAGRGREAVRRELKERVRRVMITAAFAGPVQAAIKQHLAEPQAVFRGALDSLFGEVNRAIRDGVKAVLTDGEADGLGLNSLSTGLGALSSTFKGFGIDGYAQINGDSLQRLRIDGKLALKAADEMEFRGWIQIDALNAKNPRTKCYCPDPDAMRDGVEVIVGGEAPFNLFGGGDNATKLRVQGQFAFGSCGGGSTALLGVAGSFFLQGNVSVASIQIKELGLTFAFGSASNYFGARARAAFQGYEFAGAFFAGTTCGLGPLLDVDPDIVELLTSPQLGVVSNPAEIETTRLTGLYVYAEGWMPLNNVIGIPDSCLFSLRAGAGAGPFAFVKTGSGPDLLLLGSKQFFGITADILCLAHAEASVKLLGALRIPLGGVLDQPTGVRDAVRGPTSSLALRLLGMAAFELDVGPCPFCISFSKDVKFHAQVGGDGVSFGFGH